MFDLAVRGELRGEPLGELPEFARRVRGDPASGFPAVRGEVAGSLLLDAAAVEEEGEERERGGGGRADVGSREPARCRGADAPASLPALVGRTMLSPPPPPPPPLDPARKRGELTAEPII